MGGTSEFYGVLVEADDDLPVPPGREVYFREETEAAGATVVTLLLDAGDIPDGWSRRPAWPGMVLVVERPGVDAPERFVVVACEQDGLPSAHVIGTAWSEQIAV